MGSSPTSTTHSIGSSRRRTATMSLLGTSSSRRWVPCACGRTTYEWMLDHHPDLLTGPEQWEAFYGDRPAWVFTHRTDLPSVVGAEIRFVRGDVRPVYDEMRTRRDGDVWIIGGGELVGQFDDAGLLDRMILGMCPVTLGAGAPLLPRDHLGTDARHRRPARGPACSDRLGPGAEDSARRCRRAIAGPSTRSSRR